MKKILFILILFLGTAATADIYYSVDAGCEGDMLGMGGGLVYDRDGKTPLAVGNIVQYINVGKNATPDPPGAGGSVSGDDILLLTERVGADNVWLVFEEKQGFFFNGITGKIKADGGAVNMYVRAWNTDEILPGAYYGDSQLVTPESSSIIVPLPNDVGLASFSTDKIFK